MPGLLHSQRGGVSPPDVLRPPQYLPTEEDHKESSLNWVRNADIQHWAFKPSVSFRNIDTELSFILPILCDTTEPHVIIFAKKRLVSLIGTADNDVSWDAVSKFLFSAAWLREQADYLGRKNFTRESVVKVTGSNCSKEKARVMRLFAELNRYLFLSHATKVITRSQCPKCQSDGRVFLRQHGPGC